MATSTYQETPYTSLNQNLARTFTINWETILWVVIFALAIFTRFYILGDRVMSHDESLHTHFSYKLYTKGDFQHTPLMHGPILFHMTALNYALFGANDFTARIYPAVLGVLMVLSPLLFRRWLGSWGALLAGIMILISPLLLYYNRYIRHDTPSIFYAILMFYAIIMYLNGAEHTRRKPRWLYLLAAAMVLNLGSKETAFIYIAIFGAFLTLYWLIRVAQNLWNIPGRTALLFAMMGILLGGIGALGMYIIIDIIPMMIVPGSGTPFNELTSLEQNSFILWTLLTIGFVVTVATASLFWAFRHALEQIRWRDLMLILTIAFVVGFSLLIFEEFTHTQPTGDQPAVPVVPGQEGAGDTAQGIISTIRWWPMILVWGGASAIALGILVLNNRNNNLARLKAWLHQFPEFDILILMGTLILPWLTALIPYLMKPSVQDYTAIAQALPAFLNDLILSRPNVASPQQVGQVILGFLAWLPMMSLAIGLGLLWNWRIWLVASAIFHAIFAFFFTTVFTNIDGLATGMIYSLGYWLEQQGVRRGSQPQYYYLLIIMPFYEFLPVIGSIGALFAGTTLFWRQRQKQIAIQEKIDALYASGYLKPKIAPTDEPSQQRDLERQAVSAIGPDDVILDSASVSAIERTAEISEQFTILSTQANRLSQLRQIPFWLFISWWAILNLIAYTLAGEKMPWLGTHMTLPMILLTAWLLGRVIEKVDWQKFRQSGWIYILLIPLFVTTFIQVILPFITGQRPFSGLEQGQLAQTGNWLAVVALSSAIVAVIWRFIRLTGWAHFRQMMAIGVFALLGVLTFRSAWMASFINYDLATEFLVYAHAAPAIKTVLNDIDELSLRLTDGKALRFVYDDLVPWPYSWYFRDYPNAIYAGNNPTLQQLENAAVVVIGDGNRAKVEPLLEDRYYRYDYNRLWWPMQEYFYLTAERVLNFFDLSAQNTTAPLLRQGVIDIWWNRDYTTYGRAINKDFSLVNWPVADRMHVYIRKDFAAQIWNYGVGGGEVANVLDALPVNQCNANWMPMSAVAVFEQSPLSLVRPLGIAVANSEDRVYVAEENSHRISIFTKDGQFISTIGQQGSGEAVGALFTRPNSVAIGNDGNLFVVDTWNYRIQRFTAQGEYIDRWGQAGEFGINAPQTPLDAFWGPRDIAIDNQNLAYVADTGNKRIRVYDVNGPTAVYVRDIGSGGSGDGQLDEPSSVVVDENGRIYIADYWNRRISVFNREGGFIMTFPVRGWYAEQGNRPYLALDETRQLLYVTDPDAGRVLVYNTNGDCLGSFGQLAGEVYDNTQFRLIGGIDVDEDGYVYISDPSIGRILKFEPFPIPQDTQSNSSESMLEIAPDQAETTLELDILATEEITQEPLGDE